MKNDLICRSALLVDIRESVVFSGRSGETSAEMRGAHKVTDRIKVAPAVDDVEVVRCEDCKHYGWERELCHGRTQHFCRLHKGLVCVTKDSFCSYGERRSYEKNTCDLRADGL